MSARLTIVCPECGSPLPPGGRFCPACGVRVVEAPVEAPAPVESGDTGGEVKSALSALPLPFGILLPMPGADLVIGEPPPDVEQESPLAAQQPAAG